MSIRRVNLIAGPGQRKTTTWCKTIAARKEAGLPAEGVHEVAKKYILRLQAKGLTTVGSYTQMQIFNEQFEEELIRLQAGAPLVINEGCPFISYCHALFDRQMDIAPALEDALARLDATYPALQIFLTPPVDATYDPQGRYQNQSEAMKLHQFELAQLEARYGTNFVVHSTDDIAGILATIAQAHTGLATAA